MVLNYLIPVVVQMRVTLLALLAIAFQQVNVPAVTLPVQANEATILGTAIQNSSPLIPIKKSSFVPLTEPSARAVYVLETDNSSVLYAKNPTDAVAPASTTKIMTALVAMQEYKPEEIVTLNLPQSAIGQTAELVNGEQLTVEDLLYAMMIHSGNDAALALAQHHPMGYRHFISLMNQNVVNLNLTNSHFANVSGVDSPGHYVSARDLAEITRAALNYPLLRQIVATSNHTIRDQRGWYQHQLVNLNQLIGKVPGVQGVKTGWTPTAGECLVSYVDRENQKIIVVVLGSLDRFGESEAIIEWVYANYSWLPANEL